MTGFLFNSVGKKISYIVLFVIILVLFILFISLFFFSKIAQVSEVKQVAYKYEVLIGNAKFEFEKYISTKSNENLDTFNKHIKHINITDKTIGSLYRSLKKGLSIDNAVKELQKEVDVRSGQTPAAKLIDNLMGTSLVTSLVETANKAHVVTVNWRKLANLYITESSEDQKKKIRLQLYETQKKLPAMIVQFHKSLSDIADHLTSKIKRIFIIICFVTITFICLVAFFVIRAITKPLKLTVNHVADISDGNFSDSLDIKNSDELGQMVKAMNEMSSHLRGMVIDIKEDVSTLSKSSSTITVFSNEVSESASSNAERANIVTTAAEEMSVNMTLVSEAMKTSADNTDSVVTAVEEMTATINEIAVNTENAKTIADKAVEESEGAAKQMSELNQMATAIGQVTETIKDISEQTDLLSLNATIEAARAGDAGKGFAVVAGEIKELSKQTSLATKDIQDQIDQIQQTATNSVDVIEDISKIIVDVNNIVHTIASAIEEQSIVTREIAQNTSIVFQGITDVNEKVSENSEVASRITESIQKVHESADENFNRSSSMKKKASELSDIADTLGIRMNYFKV